MRQADRIESYMTMMGSISPMEAFQDLGVTKLATRIGEMRKSGKRISQRLVKSKNRFGEDVHYMRYWLEEG